MLIVSRVVTGVTDVAPMAAMMGMVDGMVKTRRMLWIERLLLIRF